MSRAWRPWVFRAEPRGIAFDPGRAAVEAVAEGGADARDSRDHLEGPLLVQVAWDWPDAVLEPGYWGDVSVGVSDVDPRSYYPVLPVITIRRANSREVVARQYGVGTLWLQEGRYAVTVEAQTLWTDGGAAGDVFRPLPWVMRVVQADAPASLATAAGPRSSSLVGAVSLGLDAVPVWPRTWAETVLAGVDPTPGPAAYLMGRGQQVLRAATPAVTVYGVRAIWPSVSTWLSAEADVYLLTNAGQ